MKKVTSILIAFLLIAPAILLPNTNEVKLTTKKDGIASVSAAEIIDLNSYFQNAVIQNLKLLHFGKEIPIYINNDSDGLLNSGDEIIFLGQRANGDTTWFEHYTDEEPFFLIISESPSNERFLNFPDLTDYSQILNEVQYFEHFEKEKLLLAGYEDYITEISPGEIWAWDTLSPAISGSFKLPLLIPFNKSNPQTIKLKAYFISTGYSKSRELNHNLKFIFNKDTILEKAYKGGQNYFEQFDINSNYVSNGYNLFEMKSFGYRKQDNQFVYPDDVGIDYFELSARTVPFAKQGSSSFTIEKQSNNFKLNVSGFSNQKILAIDTLNRRIAILDKMQSGTTLSIVSKSGEKAFSSISVNDSLNYTGGAGGIHIGTAKVSDYSNIEFFNSSDFGKAENFLNSLPNGTVIAVSVNSQTITNGFKDILVNLGSKLISQFQNGDAFSFACIKGEKDKIFENLENYISGLYEFIKHNGGKSNQFEKVFEANKDYVLQINDLNSVEKAKVYKVNESNLKNTEINPELLIIAHEKFTEFANNYANFRAERNSLTYALVQIEDIYKEFNFGKKSPHAIKDYLKWCYRNKLTAPKYVVFIGGASWDARFILPASFKHDYIPSYGKPVSDYWYALLENDDFVPELIVGRIPVQSEEQANIYFEKLKTCENVKNAPWQKEYLLLSGGSTPFERASFLTIMFNIAQMLKNSNLCADTTIINKKVESAVAENEAGEIIRNVNAGKLWTFFFGHGSATLLDLDGWQAERLNNAGRYGIFSSFSCNTGAFAEPNVISRNEDYLFTANRGFIGASSATGVGFVDVQSELLRKTIEAYLAGGNSSYIELINKAKVQLTRNVQEINTILQYSFIGDPLLSLKINDKPNLYFVENSIEVTNIRNEKIIVESDSVAQITGLVYNQGRRYDEKVEFLLVREYNGMLDTLFMEFPSFCQSDAFTCFLNVASMPGLHKFWIIIDPENKTQSEDTTNKTYAGSFEVLNTGLLPLDPLNLWDVSSNKPEFRFINPLGNDTSFSYSFKIWDNPDTSSIPFYISQTDEVSLYENYIDWEPKIALIQNTQYWLEGKAILKSEGNQSKTNSLFFSFTANNSVIDTIAQWQIFGRNQLEQGTFDDLCFSKMNENDVLIIDSVFVPYKIAGAALQSKRFSDINIDGTIYITTPPTHRGFNLLVLSPVDFSAKRLRVFDTWSDSSDLKSDSTSIKFVEFLRDSVEYGDYLLLTTCDESTRLLNYHKKLKTTGSMDTLRTVLKEYGSALIDSLELSSTFTMLTRRGFPELTKELWSGIGDTCIIQGNFIKYLKNGNYLTQKVGPAQKWFSINNIVKTEFDSVLIEIVGLNKNMFPVILKSVNFDDNIDLSDISANEYPYLSFTIYLKRKENADNPAFGGLNCNFVPSPELAIIKSQTNFSEKNILRADDISITYQVQNIAKRGNANISKSLLTNTTTELKNVILESEIPLISRNDYDEMQFQFDTEQLNGNVSALYEIDLRNQLNELYSFNNITLDNYNVYEDTIKPQIKLFIDDVEIKDGAYVAVRPHFKVELHDNSRLAVESDESLKVRINSRIQLADNTEDYEFIGKGKETPIKAILNFKSDSLDWDENILTVYATDASGNRDTLRLSVFCSLNGFVKNLGNYPNPATSATTITFDIKAPGQENRAIIDIYDIYGRKVRTIEQIASIGKNEVLWDCTDEEGNQVASGVYNYLLTIKGRTYFEPTSSNLLIVR